MVLTKKYKKNNGEEINGIKEFYIYNSKEMCLKTMNLLFRLIRMMLRWNYSR